MTRKNRLIALATALTLGVGSFLLPAGAAAQDPPGTDPAAQDQKLATLEREIATLKRTIDRLAQTGGNDDAIRELKVVVDALETTRKAWAARADSAPQPPVASADDDLSAKRKALKEAYLAARSFEEAEKLAAELARLDAMAKQADEIAALKKDIREATDRGDWARVSELARKLQYAEQKTRPGNNASDTGPDAPDTAEDDDPRWSRSIDNIQRAIDRALQDGQPELAERLKEQMARMIEARKAQDEHRRRLREQLDRLRNNNWGNNNWGNGNGDGQGNNGQGNGHGNGHGNFSGSFAVTIDGVEYRGKTDGNQIVVQITKNGQTDTVTFDSQDEMFANLPQLRGRVALSGSGNGRWNGNGNGNFNNGNGNGNNNGNGNGGDVRLRASTTIDGKRYTIVGYGDGTIQVTWTDANGNTQTRTFADQHEMHKALPELSGCEIDPKRGFVRMSSSSSSSSSSRRGDQQNSEQRDEQRQRDQKLNNVHDEELQQKLVELMRKLDEAVVNGDADLARKLKDQIAELTAKADARRADAAERAAALQKAQAGLADLQRKIDQIRERYAAAKQAGDQAAMDALAVTLKTLYQALEELQSEIDRLASGR